MRVLTKVYTYDVNVPTVYGYTHHPRLRSPDCVYVSRTTLRKSLDDFGCRYGKRGLHHAVVDCVGHDDDDDVLYGFDALH